MIEEIHNGPRWECDSFFPCHETELTGSPGFLTHCWKILNGVFSPSLENCQRHSCFSYSLANRLLLTQLFATKIMIAIQCITLLDRKWKIQWKLGRKGWCRDEMRSKSWIATRDDVEAILMFKDLGNHRDEASLLCKSARQSMTKCPVSLSGGDSAEYKAVTHFSTTQLHELHSCVSTIMDSQSSKFPFRCFRNQWWNWRSTRLLSFQSLFFPKLITLKKQFFVFLSASNLQHWLKATLLPH